MAGLALAQLAGCATPEALETILPERGEVVSGSLVLPQTRMPLPEGRWTVIGQRTVYNDIYKINADVLLIQTKINELGRPEISDMLSISTNLQPGAGGFENICTPDELRRALYRQVTSDRLLRQDCWSIDHMEMSFSEEQLRENQDLAEARDYVRIHEILVPINMVFVKHRLSDAYNYLTIWRFYNPDLAGIPQTRYGAYEKSDWHKDHIGNFPRKQAYIEQLKQIAARWQAELRGAFF